MGWVKRQPRPHGCEQPTRELAGWGEIADGWHGDLWRCECGKLWQVSCLVLLPVWRPAGWWQRWRYRDRGEPHALDVIDEIPPPKPAPDAGPPPDFED